MKVFWSVPCPSAWLSSFSVDWLSLLLSPQGRQKLVRTAALWYVPVPVIHSRCTSLSPFLLFSEFLTKECSSWLMFPTWVWPHVIGDRITEWKPACWESPSVGCGCPAESLYILMSVASQLISPPPLLFSSLPCDVFHHSEYLGSI